MVEKPVSVLSRPTLRQFFDWRFWRGTLAFVTKEKRKY